MKKLLAAVSLLLCLVVVPRPAHAQITYFIIENLLGGANGPYNFGPTPQFCNFATVFGWNQIETGDGTYTWTNMDYAQTAAEAAGCQWVSYIVAGQYTPTWLWSDDSSSEFISCTGALNVPVPWNATFQTKWEGFASAFATRYKSDKHIIGLGLLGINTNFPSIKFPAATSGGTCATTTDATNWGACNSGPDAQGKGCQGTGDANYTIALVESTMTTLGNYMLNNINSQFAATPKPWLVIAPQAGANYPLVAGQGTASAQRAALFTTAGINWGGASASSLSTQIEFESDGLACTGPNLASCFVDSAVSTPGATYFVPQTYQESAPYSNAGAYCTGFGTPNYQCTGSGTGNAGNEVNVAIGAVENTLYANRIEIYHNDELNVTNGPQLTVNGAGVQ